MDSWLWITLSFILNQGYTVSSIYFLDDYRTIYFDSLTVNMLMAEETTYMFKPFPYYFLEEYPAEK